LMVGSRDALQRKERRELIFMTTSTIGGGSS
jgi:hypothetical protein